jgi:hypothetical protein
MTSKSQELSEAIDGLKPVAERFLPTALQTAVWAYAVFAVFSYLGSPVNEFDDAIPLVHGTLVQQGRVPNLDFYSFYPPLGIYVHAILFSVFGKSIISSRIIGIVLFFFVLLLAGRFVKSRFFQTNRLDTALVLLLAVSIGAGLGLASWPGFALSFAALLTYLLADSFPINRSVVIALSGILTGAAIMYRVNFGGYVAVVICIDVLLSWYLQGPARWNGERRRLFVLNLTAFLIPVLTVCISICLLVFGTNAGRAVSEFVVTAQQLMLKRGFLNLKYIPEFAWIITFPSAWFFFRILRGRRTLPAAAFVAAALALANLMVLLVFSTRLSAAFIGLVLEFGSVFFLHLFIKRLEPSEFTLLLFFCCQIHYYLSRADIAHSRWLPLIAVMLLPYLLFQRPEYQASANRDIETEASQGTALAVVAGLIVILSSIGDMRVHPSWARSGVELLALRLRHPRTPDGEMVANRASMSPAWLTVYTNQDELAALRYLRSKTAPEEPIFVGVGDHSRLFWSDLRIYWLADRPIGARTFQLETKIATEAPVQREIISDLSRNRVHWLILDLGKSIGDDTFNREDYQGSTLLDEYVSSHYREDARFGQYAVLSRIE